MMIMRGKKRCSYFEPEVNIVIFGNSVPLVIFFIFKDNNEWIGYYCIVFVIIQLKSFQMT